MVSLSLTFTSCTKQTWNCKKKLFKCAYCSKVTSTDDMPVRINVLQADELTQQKCFSYINQFVLYTCLVHDKIQYFTISSIFRYLWNLEGWKILNFLFLVQITYNYLVCFLHKFWMFFFYIYPFTIFMYCLTCSS